MLCGMWIHWNNVHLRHCAHKYEFAIVVIMCVIFSATIEFLWIHEHVATAVHAGRYDRWKYVISTRHIHIYSFNDSLSCTVSAKIVRLSPKFVTEQAYSIGYRNRSVSAVLSVRTLAFVFCPCFLVFYISIEWDESAYAIAPCKLV